MRAVRQEAGGPFDGAFVIEQDFMGPRTDHSISSKGTAVDRAKSEGVQEMRGKMADHHE